MKFALVLSASAALAACLLPGLAQGAEPTAAERALRLSDEGVELYRGRDYRRAIEKYATAYELDPDPNLLYNQGKCYEALGDYPGAKDKYSEFLSKPNGDVNARRKATDFVAKFNAGGFSGPPTEGAPARAGQSFAEYPSDGASGAIMRPIGYGLLAAGVLGAATGGYFFFKGTSNLDDVKDTPGYGAAGDPATVAPLTEAEAQKKIDDGTRQRTLGGILLGAGAGLAAVGVIFVVAAPKPLTAAVAALRASPLPGGAYAGLAARF